jgi:hypothetical protein
VNSEQVTGAHDVRLHWLAADLPFKMTGSPFEVVFEAGLSRVRWSIFSSVPGSAAVVRAGNQVTNNVLPEIAGADTRLLGWEAPTYGDLQPAVSLVLQTRSRLPVRFVTVVLTDERCRVESQGNEVVISRDTLREESPPSGSEYRVNLLAETAPDSKSSSDRHRFPVRELTV